MSEKLNTQGEATRRRSAARQQPRLPINPRLGLHGCLASGLLGTGIITMSVVRARTDEALAGLLIILISICLTAWLLRARLNNRALPTIAGVGWASQVAATMAYYYSGVAADAAFFHNSASRLAETGASITFTPPNWGNEGVILVLTSIYRFAGSSMLLGFVVFAALGVTGKVLFARAILALQPLLGRPSELAAVTVVILPSFAYWTSAISKESIVILGMGIVFSSLFRQHRAPPQMVGIVVGLSITALVRAHITLLLVVAVYAYIVIAFRLPARQGGRRIWPLVVGAVAVVGSVAVGTSYLGTDGLGGLEEARIERTERTPHGGSAVPFRAIVGPRDVPSAVAVLLFRPFPWEAFSARTAAQSLEGVGLAGAILWTLWRRQRRPTTIRRRADMRQLLALRWFVISYFMSFVYSFSAIAWNLGLVSRQRSQLWFVLLLALAVSLAKPRNHSAVHAPAAPFRRNAPDAMPGVRGRPTAGARGYDVHLGAQPRAPGPEPDASGHRP